MGLSSIWHWLIVLAIILLLFGTKKLSNIGSDLGKAIKGFKDGIKGEEEEKKPSTPKEVADDSTVDVDSKEKK
jgi:sec-independent protein translocase protein TatA